MINSASMTHTNMMKMFSMLNTLHISNLITVSISIAIRVFIIDPNPKMPATARGQEKESASAGPIGRKGRVSTSTV